MRDKMCGRPGEELSRQRAEGGRALRRVLAFKKESQYVSLRETFTQGVPQGLRK